MTQPPNQRLQGVGGKPSGEPREVKVAYQPVDDLREVSMDRGGDIPIGTQLVWALRARIGDGRLAPGQRLPGVRELAERFAINANTARAIYQRLEREGLVESRQGTGTFVGHAADERSGLRDLTADTARKARELGVDPRELATALYVTGEPASVPGNGSARRQQLRGQIAALEQALVEIETHNPGLLAPPEPAPRMAGPRLLSTEELEQVRARLVRRLADAQLALDASTETSAVAASSPAEHRSAQAFQQDTKQILGSRGIESSKRHPKRSATKTPRPSKTPKPSSSRRPTTRPSTA
jgi:DNA-binding transcriptional regulator YhcF (GntR family)